MQFGLDVCIPHFPFLGGAVLFSGLTSEETIFQKDIMRYYFSVRSPRKNINNCKKKRKKKYILYFLSYFFFFVVNLLICFLIFLVNLFVYYFFRLRFFVKIPFLESSKLEL